MTQPWGDSPAQVAEARFGDDQSLGRTINTNISPLTRRWCPACDCLCAASQTFRVDQHIMTNASTRQPQHAYPWKASAAMAAEIAASTRVDFPLDRSHRAKRSCRSTEMTKLVSVRPTPPRSVDNMWGTIVRRERDRVRSGVYWRELHVAMARQPSHLRRCRGQRWLAAWGLMGPPAAPGLLLWPL
jgi:hypothetical protein